MIQNPKVIHFDLATYAIMFTRTNCKVLMYVQGHFGRSMKNTNFVNSPIVQFFSREDAEKELKEKVIPYLLKEKGVELSEIVGW